MTNEQAEKTKIQRAISFWNDQGPVGGNKPYIITCNGNPFAGFDNRTQAIQVLNMYKKNEKYKFELA